MMKIGICNTKGGVGKTTLALSLAVMASEEGSRVAFLDMDPQRSLENWRQRRKLEGSPEICDNSLGVADAIEGLARNGYDVVVVDTPPAFLDEIEETMAAVDLVVIPVRPDRTNLDAMRDTVIAAKRTKSPILIVFTQVIANAKGLVEEARAALLNAKLPVAKSDIVMRAVYQTAISAGLSAHEIKGEAGRSARADLSALWGEVKAAAKAAAKAKAKGAANVA